jgi:hypothetical protein
MRLGRGIRVGYHLHETKAVSQIDKGQAAVVAIAVDPTGQFDSLANMRATQLATSVCFIHSSPPDIHKKSPYANCVGR